MNDAHGVTTTSVFMLNAATRGGEGTPTDVRRRTRAALRDISQDPPLEHALECSADQPQVISEVIYENGSCLCS